MKRESYIDVVKIFACMLVVGGHLLKGLAEAGLILENDKFNMWMEILYSFHVNLFFICSGYLYQKYTKINSVKEYGKHILKKIKVLVVPYFLFSILTLVLKGFAKDLVNSQPGNIVETLFWEPVSPYWYLYVLFMLFLIIPVMKNRYMAIFLGVISVEMVLIYWTFINSSFKPVYYIMTCSCWFIMGMIMAYGNIVNYICKKSVIPVLIILGIFIIYILYGWINYGLFFSYIRQVNSLFVCTFIFLFAMLIFKNQNDNNVIHLCADYTMIIFLMHTFFSAGVRMILIKIGVQDVFIHLLIGFLAGVIGPILFKMIFESIFNKFKNISKI